MYRKRDRKGEVNRPSHELSFFLKRKKRTTLVGGRKNGIGDGNIVVIVVAPFFNQPVPSPKRSMYPFIQVRVTVPRL